MDLFDNHGRPDVTVDNRGVGGTFAQTWALTPNALRDAVTANPDATNVWLMLGGNDGIARLAVGQRPIEDIVEVPIVLHGLGARTAALHRTYMKRIELRVWEHQLIT